MYTAANHDHLMASPMSTHARMIGQVPYKKRIFGRRSPFAAMRKLAMPIMMMAVCGGLLAWPGDAHSNEVAIDGLKTWKTSDQAIPLEANSGMMVTLPKAVSTVFVANPEIADVQLKSPKLIYLHARRPGETTIFAADEKDDIILNHRVVVTHNLARLQEMIQQVRPEARIQAASLNQSVVLTGTVASAQEADDVRTLAARLLGEDGSVINRLQIATPQQVNLRVKIAEVTRTVSKELGFDIGLVQTIGDATINVATGAFLGGATAGTNQILGNITSGNTDLDLLIDALDQNELITLLAEPNLTAESGKAANFLVGGEFPIPVSDGEDGISVEFKQFGVGLSFVPLVMDDGRISIQILTEVSELSAAGAVTINNIQVPALTTRRAETTVNLGSGQSFAIAGLLQNTSNQNLDQFPGLGELPVLGTLFRSTQFEKGESELVVIVTPYLVRPVSERLSAPTDQFQPPTETERILLGEQNRVLPASPRLSVVGNDGLVAPKGRAGFILK